jgi:transposase
LVSVRTAYKCRAYPTAEQASALNRTFGYVRVWNRTLAWRPQRYYAEQVKTNFTQASADLTAMKPPKTSGDGGHERLPADGQMTARWRT